MEFGKNLINRFAFGIDLKSVAINQYLMKSIGAMSYCGTWECAL